MSVFDSNTLRQLGMSFYLHKRNLRLETYTMSLNPSAIRKLDCELKSLQSH